MLPRADDAGDSDVAVGVARNQYQTGDVERDEAFERDALPWLHLRTP